MPGLTGVVRCRWEQEITEETQRVIPDNCADVLLIGDRAVLVGPATHAELPGLPVGTRISGLRFEPYAIRAVFGVAADELTDRTLPLDAVLGSRTARLFRHEAPAHDWLRARWDAAAPERATIGVVRALTEREPLDAVAHHAGYSGRHLRRLVRTETGLSPKTLQRVARLHDFLRRAETAPVGVAAVAAGYADQPHASREIRALTGLTPRGLLAERVTPYADTGDRSVARSSP